MKNAEKVNRYGFFIGLPTKKIENTKLKKLIKHFENTL